MHEQRWPLEACYCLAPQCPGRSSSLFFFRGRYDREASGGSHSVRAILAGWVYLVAASWGPSRADDGGAGYAHMCHPSDLQNANSSIISSIGLWAGRKSSARHGTHITTLQPPREVQQGRRPAPVQPSQNSSPSGFSMPQGCHLGPTQSRQTKCCGTGEAGTLPGLKVDAQPRAQR